MQINIKMLFKTKRWIYHVSESSFVKNKGYRVSIVFENVQGYFPTGGNGKEPWYWGGDLKDAETICEARNAERGISKEEAMFILMSSMYPAATGRN